MLEVEQLTVERIRAGIGAKEFTAEAVVKAFLERIEKLEPEIDSFITLWGEEALAQARRVDEKVRKGEPLGPLAGVPIAIKDNICTDGLLTTCASKMLADFIPPYDATVVRKIKAADGIIIGKTNMDEFAMGSSNENSAFKKTRNPWHLDRVPGGSSGGSAAAVAAKFVPLALGSDTGGSIRQPAAFCGIVGLKPTYGLVSRYGLIAFASSLDQIGPMANRVKDCAIALQVLQGNDPMDSTSVQQGVETDYLSHLDQGVRGMRIAVAKEFFQEGLDPEIQQAMVQSIEAFRALGAVVEEISLPITQEGLSAYYIISSAEASSNLARFDGIRYGHRPKEFEKLEELMEGARTEGFGPEVKRRILLGTYVLSSGYYDAYYNRAQKLRRQIIQQYKQVFETYDLLLSPTTPSVAYGIGEKVDNPLAMYLGDIYTIGANLAKLPGISLPCGFNGEGLPIGLQLLGGHYTEKKLLQAAYSLEQHLKISGKLPLDREGIQ